MPQKIRVKSKGYSEAGASTTKRALKAFIAASGSPQEDIDYNISILRQRSRMLYMASPLATSAINTNRTKVVGTGLKLKASVDAEILGISAEEAKKWQHQAEVEFNLWANKKQNCDAIGLNNFAEMQQLVLKSWLMSGDSFALICHDNITLLNPYGLRIKLVEADRIYTPSLSGGLALSTILKIPDGMPGAGHRIFDGVEVADDGKIVAYHISDRYPQSGILTEKASWQRIVAYGAETGLPNILHIMDSERVDQYRGVPYLAQVIEPLLQLRRYTESELMAALIQSFFTAWIQTESDPTDFPINEIGAGNIQGTEPAVDSYSSENQNEYEMSPGTVTHLQPGEEIHFGQPNIPNAGFKTFVETLSKLIGAALELPYDVITKSFNASYSASRGALLEAWEAFKMRRSWLVSGFCQPVYEIWLAEAVARGRIKAPGFFENPLYREAWCKARWIGPVQGQLDPLKEMKAAIAATECGIKTHEQVALEQGGGDWESNVVQLKHENDLLYKARSPAHKEKI